VTSGGRSLAASTGDIHDDAVASLNHRPGGRFLAGHDSAVEVLAELKPHNPSSEPDFPEKASCVNRVHADQVGHPDQGPGWWHGGRSIVLEDSAPKGRPSWMRLLT
jgi:hypothetical protein